MKRTAVLIWMLVFAALFLLLPGCSLIASLKAGDEPPQTPAPAAETPQSTPAGEEQAPADTPQESPDGQAVAAVFTNDQLKQNVMALRAFVRKTYTISIPPPDAGDPIDTYYETAYIKEPFAMYGLNESAAWGFYSEAVIIGDRMWERSDRDGEWTEAPPEKLTPETKPVFSYDPTPMPPLTYPINYEKLTLTEQGIEQVNGYDCVKYAVSGSYEETFTAYAGTEYESEQQIALSAEGELWVLSDPGIGPVLIRQRLTLDKDITNPDYLDENGNPIHFISKDIVYDDLMNIDEVSLWEPTGTEDFSTGPVEVPSVSAAPEESPATGIVGFVPARDRSPGPFSEEDAVVWTKHSWMSDYGPLVFKWVNGYIVAYYSNDGINISPGLAEDENIITSLEGRTYKGELRYGNRFGTFEFTLSETGDAFEGIWKYSDQKGYERWDGYVIIVD